MQFIGHIWREGEKFMSTQCCYKSMHTVWEMYLSELTAVKFSSFDTITAYTTRTRLYNIQINFCSSPTSHQLLVIPIRLQVSDKKAQVFKTFTATLL